MNSLTTQQQRTVKKQVNSCRLDRMLMWLWSLQHPWHIPLPPISLMQNPAQYSKPHLLWSPFSELPTFNLEVVLSLLILWVICLNLLLYVGLFLFLSQISSNCWRNLGCSPWLAWSIPLIPCLLWSLRIVTTEHGCFFSANAVLSCLQVCSFILFNILHQLCLTTFDPFKDLVREPWKYNLLTYVGTELSH